MPRLALIILVLLLLAGCVPTPAAVAADPVAGITAAPMQEIHTAPTQTAVVQPSPISPPETATMEAAACVETRGRLSDTSVPAPLLPDPLAVRVYTPPCFDPSGSTHYPVLYLLHGQNYPITQWDDLGADEAADSLITSGEARPFLIVMPGEELDLVDVRDSRYGDALVESLVPWVDRTYPTCTQAVCRAIGGISRGAGWAVHLALRHPELFAAAGGHSLAVFTGEATHLAETLAGIPPQNVPRFTLDSGRYDRYLDSALEFEQALNRAGVAHEWYLFEGIHDDAYWQAHVGGYIRWYAEVLENR